METTTNNQPKHTQGEWKTEMWGGVPFAIVTGKDGVIAEIDSRNREANAKLIASAPYLLEALKSTLNTETESGMCSFIIGGKIHSEIILAIKKATE